MKMRAALIALLLVAVTVASCSTGVSTDDFEAVQRDLQAQQAQVQSLQAQVAELQQRMSRAASIAEALELFTSPPEGTVAPEPKLLQELSALVQTSGDNQLQAKWSEVAGAVFATAGAPPLELVGELASLIQASRYTEIQEKFREFAAAAIRGEGAGAALELATLIQQSGDAPLQTKMQEFVQAIMEAAELPTELFDEFARLALASANKEIYDKVLELSAPPPGFIDSFEAKVRAIGDPSLNAQLEGLFTPGLEPGRHAEFLKGLNAALQEALK